MTKAFENTPEPRFDNQFIFDTKRSMFVPGADVHSYGIYSGIVPSELFFISVMEESSLSELALDASYSAFRSAHPTNKLTLLTPTHYLGYRGQDYTGLEAVYGPNNSTYPAPTYGVGGWVNALQYATARSYLTWIPEQATTDSNFSRYPVTSVEYLGFPAEHQTNWVTLTGVDELPAGSRVVILMDTSDYNLYTYGLQVSYGQLADYCSANDIELITINTNADDWVAPLVATY